MSRKYRRTPYDLEILIALQDVTRITENMELLDADVVQEVVATLGARRTHHAPHHASAQDQKPQARKYRHYERGRSA